MSQDKFENIQPSTNELFVLRLDDWGCLDRDLVKQVFHEVQSRGKPPAFNLMLTRDHEVAFEIDAAYRGTLISQVAEKFAYLLEGFLLRGKSNRAYLSVGSHSTTLSDMPIDFTTIFSAGDCYQTLPEILKKRRTNPTSISLVAHFGAKKVIYQDHVFFFDPSFKLSFQLDPESNPSLHTQFQHYANNMTNQIKSFACPLIQLLQLSQAASAYFLHLKSVHQAIILQPLSERQCSETISIEKNSISSCIDHIKFTMNTTVTEVKQQPLPWSSLPPMHSYDEDVTFACKGKLYAAYQFVAQSQCALDTAAAAITDIPVPVVQNTAFRLTTLSDLLAKQGQFRPPRQTVLQSIEHRGKQAQQEVNKSLHDPRGKFSTLLLEQPSLKASSSPLNSGNQHQQELNIQYNLYKSVR